MFHWLVPVNLTEQGIRQAESIRSILEKIPFDKVVTGDLHRAMKTAETAIPGSNVTGNNCVIGVFEYENAHWKLHSWINQ